MKEVYYMARGKIKRTFTSREARGKTFFLEAVLEARQAA